ncbi:hypothetical protein BHM03_00057934 [Ensete ventricosum]|nr:hypothetical protein BHM03_00057934 [Ensete ventricosum]
MAVARNNDSDWKMRAVAGCRGSNNDAASKGGGQGDRGLKGRRLARLWAKIATVAGITDGVILWPITTVRAEEDDNGKGGSEDDERQQRKSVVPPLGVSNNRSSGVVVIVEDGSNFNHNDSKGGQQWCLQQRRGRWQGKGTLEAEGAVLMTVATSSVVVLAAGGR